MTSVLLEIVFWGSILALVFVYAGYPFVLAAFTAVFHRKVHRQAGFSPRVSILISAYNEEEHIEATIVNKLSLAYPKEKIEILVTSDESTDRTDSIVKKFKGQGVRLFRQEPRQGKTAALNKMAEQATGDILVFSDANSIYDKDALSHLASNFADPSIGYVTGKMIYVDENGSVVGSGCTAYMRYENLLRHLETRAGSVIGVDGGIDAVRRSLYVPMKAELLPDFVLPLEVIRQGKRVIYDSAALLKEPTLSQVQDEWKMRVRVILRSFHALRHMKTLLNPFRRPLISFQIFSHKILRYLAGLFQVSALTANALLAVDSPPYRLVLIFHAMFYVFAWMGSTKGSLSRFPGARYAFYLCLLNGSSMAALSAFLAGKNQTTWTPRKG